jgi:hypothetical protein
VLGDKVNQQITDERADDSARVIHRAMKAEGDAAFSVTESAIIASRGALRIPLPTRSVRRMANT